MAKAGRPHTVSGQHDPGLQDQYGFRGHGKDDASCGSPGQQFNFYPRGGTIFDNRVSTIKVDHNFNQNHKLSLTTTVQSAAGRLLRQRMGLNCRSMAVRIRKTSSRSTPE